MFKKYNLFVLFLIFCNASAVQNDNNITVNFTGSVSKPSCQIEFEGEGVSKSIDFGKINVSDVRYYAQNAVYGYTVAKYIATPQFNMEISGCSPEQIAADNTGYQFSLTIEPVSGKWHVTAEGDPVGYMGGAIEPLTGATGYAAKFLVPFSTSLTAIPMNPTQWSVFTGPGISTRKMEGNVPVGDVERGIVSNFKVALAYLPQSIENGTTKFKIPMKIKLGMTETTAGNAGDPGASGEFNVSAKITVTYF